MTELEALKICWQMARRFHQSGVLRSLVQELKESKEVASAAQVAKAKALQGEATEIVWGLIQRVATAEACLADKLRLIEGALVDTGYVTVDRVDLDRIREGLKERGRPDLAAMTNAELASFVETALDAEFENDLLANMLSDARERALDLIEGNGEGQG
jgi:hypothetical protein